MKPRRKKVSIIIPFYNCPYVHRAIESALRQTYSSLEIIIVDDGSTQYAERILPYLSNSKVYCLGKSNGGTATALNHGIRHSSGDYIAWLSSDDLFYRHKVSTQLQYMLKQGAEVSHTNFNYINAAGKITRRRAGGTYPSTRALAESFMSGNPVNGCTVMIRRDVFDRYGLFDERLPYTHDLEFWFRLLLSGVRFDYLDLPLTAYRWHERMGTLRHSDAIREEIQLVRGQYEDKLRASLTAIRG
ncbi:glycosyl transferase [Paenibacillus sp. CAA11]|uniref:glycosyltransferase n=1 Tax=Paenibacillus sp. CAA11 TaxID=1532905 RepID=UPI000D3B5197|nr:glycosyltransferase [Paenibacillus sp. CAA11]AWB45807.1 glycosyl transferase [Paenibacillus sp. CAA11]